MINFYHGWLPTKLKNRSLKIDLTIKINFIQKMISDSSTKIFNSSKLRKIPLNCIRFNLEVPSLSWKIQTITILIMESSILINFFSKFLRKLMDYCLMCSLDSMEVENRNLLLMELLELIFFKITVKRWQFINLMMKNLIPQITQEGMLDKLVHKESEKGFYLGNAPQDKWQLTS